VDWRDQALSIAEIMPFVETLSQSEKLQLARLLIDGVANDDSSIDFKEGQVYPIYTPEYSPGAAAQLAQVLKDFEPQP
jgi:hypothetical protein